MTTPRKFLAAVFLAASAAALALPTAAATDHRAVLVGGCADGPG